MKTTARIFSAPFVKLHFQDCYIADQYVSLAIVMYDFEYLLCFYSYDAWYRNDPSRGAPCMAANSWTRPAIAALPLLCRFVQQIRRYYDNRRDHRQLVNAGKYACGILTNMVAVLKNFFPSVPVRAPAPLTCSSHVMLHVIMFHTLITLPRLTFRSPCRHCWSCGFYPPRRRRCIRTCGTSCAIGLCFPNVRFESTACFTRV